MIELTADQRMVVLHGPEAFLRSLYTDHLRSALSKVHGEIEIVRHDGKASQAVDVLDDCRSFGLIQQHKLVIVDDADEFLKSSEDEEWRRAAGRARAEVQSPVDRVVLRVAQRERDAALALRPVARREAGQADPRGGRGHCVRGTFGRPGRRVGGEARELGCQPGR